MFHHDNRNSFSIFLLYPTAICLYAYEKGAFSLFTSINMRASPVTWKVCFLTCSAQTQSNNDGHDHDYLFKKLHTIKGKEESSGVWTCVHLGTPPLWSVASTKKNAKKILQTWFSSCPFSTFMYFFTHSPHYIYERMRNHSYIIKTHLKYLLFKGGEYKI